MKEQSQNHARKRIKSGCYLKVTLVHRGLSFQSVWIQFVGLWNWHHVIPVLNTSASSHTLLARIIMHRCNRMKTFHTIYLFESKDWESTFFQDLITTDKPTMRYNWEDHNLDPLDFFTESSILVSISLSIFPFQSIVTRYFFFCFVVFLRISLYGSLLLISSLFFHSLLPVHIHT